MKSKSINEIVSLDSLAITAIISYWKDYDKTTVIISYLELQRRKFILDSSVEKKLNEFCRKQNGSLEELINEYKNGEDINSEIQTVLKNRYLVTLKADGFTYEELKSALSALNNSALK